MTDNIPSMRAYAAFPLRYRCTDDARNMGASLFVETFPLVPPEHVAR
jgi:hypothetical protein